MTLKTRFLLSAKKPLWTIMDSKLALFLFVVLGVSAAVLGLQAGVISRVVWQAGPFGVVAAYIFLMVLEFGLSFVIRGWASTR